MDKDKVLPFGIGEPMSWRGIYNEVAFSVQENITVQQSLDNIIKAYHNVFYGWKGGEYTYDDDTPVNFESDAGRYTDGGYCLEMIATLEGSSIYQSNEEELVNLIISQ